MSYSRFFFSTLPSTTYVVSAVSVVYPAVTSCLNVLVPSGNNEYDSESEALGCSIGIPMHGSVGKSTLSLYSCRDGHILIYDR